MATDTIRWNTENFIGKFDNRWVVVNGSITNGVLTLNGGGSATLTLVEEVNVEFKYYRLRTVFESEGLSMVNNYRNKPTIFIQEVYKDSNNVPYRTRVRSLGFNTTFKDSNNRYTDDTVLTTLDRKMFQFKIVIKNELSDPLTIYSFEMFQSQDISDSQVMKIVNTLQKEGEAEHMKIYRNEDGSINGLGIFIPGSTLEIKFRPAYFEGRIIAIDTNFGQTVGISNIIGQIDLGTSSTL